MILPDEIADKGITLKDQYFDLKGASAYSSLAISTLREHIRKGLPAFKVGGKILIRLSEFDRWMERHRVNRDQDLTSIIDSVIDELRG